MDSPRRSGGHKCRYRQDEGGWWNRFVNWWILPAHLVLASLFTLVALRLLQGRHFLVTGSENHQGGARTFRLYQSDVSTLISVALVLIRTLAGCWLTLTGWRMAFIVMERNGATLEEVDHMVSYRIPPFKFWTGAKWKARWTLASMWIIFILALPTQFLAPIFNGAINWIPGTDFLPSQSQAAITTASPAASQWDAHNLFSNNRFYEVLSASGLASIASPVSFHFNESTVPKYRAPSRRLIPSLLGTAVNSSLANVTVPYFEIHSLDWIVSVEQIENDIGILESIISSTAAPTLNYSNEFGNDFNPFSFGTDKGRLALVNGVGWRPAPFDVATQTYVYPRPTTKTTEQWVIVNLQQFQDCSFAISPAFGLTPNIYKYSSPNVGNCYAFARIHYTAAALTCRDCLTVLDGVVEAANTTEDTFPWTPIPDPLVEIAISMMSEVLFYMKISNSSQAPSWENLDGYTRGMLTTAYQASWNSLTNAWQQAPFVATNISTPYPVLIAQVNTWRVATWFALNALLTVSGILLALTQRTCRNKTLRDPALVALLLDMSAVLAEDRNGLCNAICLRGRDKSLRLRLKVSGADENARYAHPRVEIDTDKGHGGDMVYDGAAWDSPSGFSSREGLWKGPTRGFEHEFEMHDASLMPRSYGQGYTRI